jgi:heat shock protein HslJ
MRKLVVLLVLAVGAVTLLGACSGSGSSSASASAAGLTGKTWQWTASTTKVPASQNVVPDPQNYTIEFKSDGTFSAKADCNQLAGTYTTTSSGGLTIVPGPMTLALCPDASLDTLYIAGLTATQSYTIANNQLTTKQADEATMTFS